MDTMSIGRHGQQNEYLTHKENSHDCKCHDASSLSRRLFCKLTGNHRLGDIDSILFEIQRILDLCPCEALV